MTELMVETRDLSKRYRRKGPWAVRSLSLRVPRGALFGFIGPNGAGKTTALRMLAGLLEPSGGEIIIAGQSAQHQPQTMRQFVGYMPDAFGVYHEMTAWEYLDFFARCHDLPAKRREAVVSELLELVNLSHKRNDDVGSLSRGMQQRLCLAQALVHDPALLLLDEPASGLDPRARVEMRELLRELSALGKTVILSSHILSELAEMCDEVGIIEHGRIVASGPLASLQQRAQPARVLRVQVVSDAAGASEALTGFPGVSNVTRPNGGRNGESAEGTAQVWLEAYLTGDAHAASALLAHLVQSGVAVAEFRQVGNELEELFLQLTSGDADGQSQAEVAGA